MQEERIFFFDLHIKKRTEMRFFMLIVVSYRLSYTNCGDYFPNSSSKIERNFSASKSMADFSAAEILPKD